MIDLKEIKAAQRRLEGKIERTLLLSSDAINKLVGKSVFFKAENRQTTGSFKIRGALNAVLLAPNAIGYIAFSSGNHGKALAYAAKLAGKPCVIVMPEDTPEYKKKIAREYGAEVVSNGVTIINRIEKVAELTEQTSYEFIPPYDDYWVIAGQGTLALEILDDQPDVQAILVAVGGGGLISGVASAVKQLNPKIEVIGVEPEVANDAQQSLEKGERVSLTSIPETIADSVRTMILGEKTFPIIQETVERIVTVPEGITKKAVKILEDLLGEKVEPTAAMTFAPLLMDYDLPEKVAVILCGKSE
ncbi:MAG: threonine/serine dehydratase [Patescibacteria group bacterium]